MSNPRSFTFLIALKQLLRSFAHMSKEFSLCVVMENCLGALNEHIAHVPIDDGLRQWLVAFGAAHVEFLRIHLTIRYRSIFPRVD